MLGLADLLADTTGSWLLVGIGVLGGLAFAYCARSQMLSVTVSLDSLTLVIGTEHIDIARTDAAAVFLDGKTIVVTDAGLPLAREESGLVIDELRIALESHGYPWRDRHPH